MSIQWLALRITEEQERRQREAAVLERLPRALNALFDSLKTCVDDYTAAFGKGSAEIRMQQSSIEVDVQDEHGGSQPRARVRIDAVPALPGFRISAEGEPIEIEVGLLPENRLFYKFQDQYLTVEQLTRHALDRALFPKLGE